MIAHKHPHSSSVSDALSSPADMQKELLYIIKEYALNVYALYIPYCGQAKEIQCIQEMHRMQKTDFQRWMAYHFINGVYSIGQPAAQHFLNVVSWSDFLPNGTTRCTSIRFLHFFIPYNKIFLNLPSLSFSLSRQTAAFDPHLK